MLLMGVGARVATIEVYLHAELLTSNGRISYQDRDKPK